MRISAQSAAMVTVLLLILAAAVGVKLARVIDLTGGYFGQSAASQLDVGQDLAKDLNDSTVDEAKKQEILARLEEIRDEFRQGDLDPAEQDMWLRIDTAIRLRHIQVRQIADIDAKQQQCQIAEVHADPIGLFVSSPVETVCAH